MDITILGSGRVGEALGCRWAKKGHRIFFGVPDTADDAVRAVLDNCGPQASAGTVKDAAAKSDVILLAIPWNVAKDVLQSIGSLKDKILIDCINPILSDFSGLDPNATPSAAEQIVSWAPEATVVKAFNTISDATMVNPCFGDQQAAMFYCGDDKHSKSIVRQLAVDLDLEPIDSGPLKNAGHLSH